MPTQVCDYSDDDRRQFDLDSLKIDPVIVHLVSMNGPEWSAPVASSGADSNLRCRALKVVAQIMDLDLSKERDKDQAESLLYQDKEDGPGGPEVILENATAGLDMRSGIDEFWSSFEQGSQDDTETMVEADAHETHSGMVTVASGEGERHRQF